MGQMRCCAMVVSMCLCMGLCVTGAAAGTISDPYITPDGKELGLVFDEGTGLSGQAIFKLGADNKTIEILLTNTSTAIPDVPYFDNPADQVLTSLYFDLGAPGLNPGDPVIIGGAAWVASGSIGVAGATGLVEGDDISHLWGYGNYQYGDPMSYLSPNFITTLTSHATPFEPGKLQGPNYGGVSALNLDGAFDTGLPLISDTVYAVVNLDQPIASLADLIGPGKAPAYIEFGSDFEFHVADCPPPPPPIIPEPATMLGALLGLGGIGAYLRRRRRA